ncbi:uncharacterized protein LOC119609553 [Lucilia sericata]|uniref:uncharacterized protein LOC119609553 n=1 Tax=Lucilia sericata TaxID=13632 RepID=UPI0018A843CF|nr:uncharacterized protein LOC119609553 [Lucilia sericata]
MKFSKIIVLITIVILSMFKPGQGKSDGKNLVYKDFPRSFKNFSREKNLESRPYRNTKPQEAVNNNNYLLPPVIKDFTGEHNFKSTNTKTNIYDLAQKLSFNKNPLKLSKSPTLETSHSKENNIPYKTINSQKVYCRQIMKSDLNTQGNIIDSVQHICDPLPLQTTSVKTTFRQNLKTTTSPFSTTIYAAKEKRFERLVTSTPARGYNCRRVMNSELNERGEIVDSVTEVCDPPTTTTTTTRKPTMTTTTKATTTTPKPLVKVCRPVMNSYLSEEGEIIDSVTMVCNMEKVD